MMRFDNGRPWGNPQIRVPTALALWLVGLGIHPLFGRPRQSTDNAVVERCHGVLNAWVEPQQCADARDLAQRLDKFARLQRQDYPACEGQTRLKAFPQLEQQARPYDRQQDQHLWHLQAVLHYVAQFVFTRTVEKNGRITLLTHEYALGRAYRAQKVTVQLDPLQTRWLVKDRYGALIHSFPAQQFTYPTLEGLQLSDRQTRVKPPVVSDGVKPYDV